MGFASTLTLIFVVLQCCGRIDWSWRWVLCPAGISALLCLAALAAVRIGGRIQKGVW